MKILDKILGLLIEEVAFRYFDLIEWVYQKIENFLELCISHCSKLAGKVFGSRKELNKISH